MKYNTRDAQKISFQSEVSEQIFVRFLSLFEEHFESKIEIKRLSSSASAKDAHVEGDHWAFPLFYEDQFLAVAHVHNQRPGQKMEEIENFLELFLKPLLVSEFLEAQNEHLRPEIWTLQSKSELVSQDAAIILHDITQRMLFLPMEQLLAMDLKESSVSETSLFVPSLEKLSLEDQQKMEDLFRRPAENTALYIGTRLSREDIKSSDLILPSLRDLLLDRWVQVDALPSEYKLRREALRLFMQRPADVVEQKRNFGGNWDS